MFSSLITRWSRLRASAIAIISDRGQGISFRRLEEMVSQVAAALGPLLPGRQKLVAIQFAQPLPHWILTLAVARLGHVSVAETSGTANYALHGEGGPTGPGHFVLDVVWWLV